MIKIRLWGTPEEVSEFAAWLERTPCVRVLQRSEGYPDRGKSVYERVYIEAQLQLPAKTNEEFEKLFGDKTESTAEAGDK